MTMTDIMNLIYELSGSQGFYGRLFFALTTMRENDPDRFDDLTRHWEDMNFKDAIDFILYIEG